MARIQLTIHIFICCKYLTFNNTTPLFKRTDSEIRGQNNFDLRTAVSCGKLIRLVANMFTLIKFSECSKTSFSSTAKVAGTTRHVLLCGSTSEGARPGS